MLGLRDAENYAVFALFLTYTFLDCLGGFGNSIAKRETLPFQPAQEAVKKIRQAWSISSSRFSEEEMGGE